MKLIGENSLEIAELTKARRHYKEEFYPVQNVTNYPIDFLYEQPNYGLTNSLDETVYVLTDEQRVNLKKFQSVDIYGLNFVADAFDSFRKEMMDLIFERRAIELPIIGQLLPAESFIDFEDLYYKYLRAMQDFLINEYIIDYDVIDFGDLMVALRDFVLTMSREHPITRSGFIDSRNCPLTTSGLIVDIGKQDCSLDAPKGDIIQHRAYSCYVEYAYKHGFSIDKNAPWRLVFNLEAPTSRQYLLPYGNSSLSNEQILDTRYRTKSHYDDLYDLQDYAFQLYQTLLAISPFHSKKEGKKRSFISRRSMVWYNESRFDKKFWIKFLFDARLCEIGHTLEYEEYNLELNQIYSHLVIDTRSALGKLGSVISSKKKKNTNIDSYVSTKVKDYIR